MFCDSRCGRCRGRSGCRGRWCESRRGRCVGACLHTDVVNEQPRLGAGAGVVVVDLEVDHYALPAVGGQVESDPLPGSRARQRLDDRRDDAIRAAPQQHGALKVAACRLRARPEPEAQRRRARRCRDGDRLVRGGVTGAQRSELAEQVHPQRDGAARGGEVGFCAGLVCGQGCGHDPQPGRPGAGVRLGGGVAGRVGRGGEGPGGGCLKTAVRDQLGAERRRRGRGRRNPGWGRRAGGSCGWRRRRVKRGRFSEHGQGRARCACDIIESDPIGDVAGVVIPGVPVAGNRIVEEVFDGKERRVAVVPEGGVIGEAAGGRAFDLDAQPLAVAGVRGREAGGQADGAGLGAAVDLQRAVAVTVPADHVQVEVAHHLRAGCAQRSHIAAAAPHPLLFTREVDEADGVADAVPGQDAGDNQRGRSARGVVVRTGRTGVGCLGHVVEVPADQPDPLRMDRAAQLRNDVAAGVAAVGPGRIADRQAQFEVALVEITLGVPDRGGQGVARCQYGGCPADIRRPLAAQLGDAIGDGLGRHPG